MNVTPIAQLLKRKSAPDSPKPRPASTARGGGAGPRGGQLVFLAALVLASFLAGVRFDSGGRFYLAGEIAERDVIADRDMLIEDPDATRKRREQVAAAQPPVFDFSLDPIRRLERGVADALSLARNSPMEDLEQVRWQISEIMNVEIRRETLLTWREPDFPRFVAEGVLPWLRTQMAEGVVEDGRKLAGYAKTGVLIRGVGGTGGADADGPPSAGQAGPGASLETPQTGADAPRPGERLRLDLDQIRDLERLKVDLEDTLRRRQGQSLRHRRATFQLIEPNLAPTLSLNVGLTARRVSEAAASVESAYRQIRRGEIVIRQGEAVDAERQSRLQALFGGRGATFQPQQAGGVFLLSCLIMAGLGLSSKHRRQAPLVSKDWIFLAFLALMFPLLAKFMAEAKGPLAHAVPALARHPEMLAFALPVAGSAGVMALFFPQNVCFFMNLLTSFLCARLAGGDLGLFSYFFLGSMFYSFLIKETETRQEVLKSCFPLMGGLFCTFAGITLMDFKSVSAAGGGLPFVLTGGLFSFIFLLASSPIAEHVFGYSSRFRLMELMSLEQPLLRELMVSAPGTYHHSLIVSNMAEASARAIGANALLAKVAALYHDVGKLKNPHYFIENQFSKENKHNKLSPSMSALIITSHVKKGAELAREHNLGQEIIDLIQQHHGTSLISFFYNKALELAAGGGTAAGPLNGGAAAAARETVREDDYRYPGPKPQTKEAALLMLADMIEASARTLVDPTPARIQGHIDKIIRKVFTEGQLDESELTLRDLTLTGEACHRILTGIFHHRIEYPGSRADARPDAKPDSRSDAKSDAKPEGKNGEAAAKETAVAGAANGASKSAA